MNDLQFIGAGLVGTGSIFLLLGIVTFLNRRFLITGNVLLLLGMPLLLSVRDFCRTAFQLEKIKGKIAFCLGVVLIFMKFSLPGVICELIGCILLFGNFISIFLGKIPFFRSLLPSGKKEHLDL